MPSGAPDWCLLARGNHSQPALDASLRFDARTVKSIIEMGCEVLTINLSIRLEVLLTKDGIGRLGLARVFRLGIGLPLSSRVHRIPERYG